jgi:hypothetical protein
MAGLAVWLVGPRPAPPHRVSTGGSCHEAHCICYLSLFPCCPLSLNCFAHTAQYIYWAPVARRRWGGEKEEGVAWGMSIYVDYFMEINFC